MESNEPLREASFPSDTKRSRDRNAKQNGRQRQFRQWQRTGYAGGEENKLRRAMALMSNEGMTFGVAAQRGI